jgi:transcriptional regulator GlxA family with amidase domain
MAETRTRNFGFLVFPDLEELDLVGPWEMISVWSKFLEGPERCLMVAQSREPVRCAKGMVLQPHATFADCPPLDYLLVPGGQGTRREVDNAALVGFVAAQAPGCRAVLSVCTGSFILHRAGLLAGRRATTHWGSLARLADLGGVEVVPERFVRDGNLWTAAGVSAGIDLALALIAEIAGETVAGKVQLGAEYFPSGRIYGAANENPAAPAYARKPAPPDRAPGGANR